ncbi:MULTISPECIES: hypothetical protein [Thermincola]|nr:MULTISPECIES: hypothetical protein [Thermincola]
MPYYGYMPGYMPGMYPGMPGYMPGWHPDIYSAEAATDTEIQAGANPENYADPNISAQLFWPWRFRFFFPFFFPFFWFWW